MYLFFVLVVLIVIDNSFLIVGLCLLNRCVIKFELWLRFNVNWVKLFELIEKLLKYFKNLFVSKVFDGNLYIMIILRLFLLCLRLCFLSNLIMCLFFLSVCINGIMILMLVIFILLWICLIVLYFNVK